jgi:hypothetical protein
MPVLDREVPLPLEIVTLTLSSCGIEDRSRTFKRNLSSQTPKVRRHTLEETGRLENALGQADAREVWQKGRELPANLDGVKGNIQRVSSQWEVARTQRIQTHDVWVKIPQSLQIRLREWLQTKERGGATIAVQHVATSTHIPHRGRNAHNKRLASDVWRRSRSPAWGTIRVCRQRAARRRNESVQQESADVLGGEETWHPEHRGRRLCGRGDAQTQRTRTLATAMCAIADAALPVVRMRSAAALPVVWMRVVALPVAWMRVTAAVPVVRVSTRVVAALSVATRRVMLLRRRSVLVHRRDVAVAAAWGRRARARGCP